MSKAKDDDSWKGRSIQRRDFRHSHDAPETPRRGKSKKKDTKRWCKGKVGVEHDLERVDKYRSISQVDKCKKCGKELGFYWKSGKPPFTSS